ncbi:G-alpha-domain-containing protein [Amylocystis lapponica]|nr:G-alpha-domain-containing protein [Amylocystis lapponica]
MQSRFYRHRPADDDPLARVLAPPPDELPEEREARLLREANAQRISDDIDERIRLERLSLKAKNTFKLLLLGQSESGKSTTLKNLQMTFAPEAWKAERTSWRTVILLNLVRSINTILDVLAEEIVAAGPAKRPPTSLSSLDSPTSPTPSERPHSAADGVSPGRHDPLEFSNTHALLKLRLAPLRRVEADLKVVLGAASVEIASNAPGPAEPLMVASPFDMAHDGGSRADELCVRSHRSWRDALTRPRRGNGFGRRNRSGSGGAVGPCARGTPDELADTTKVIAGCKDDMVALWNDEVVRAMLRRRRIRLEETPGFFLDDIERIASRTYEPSDDDVVRARLRTLGVQEYNIVFENQKPSDMLMSKEWTIYDVGGSRTSRAAWLPYFEDINAILFLAPISCFDELLAEDRRVNRLEDTWMLWKSIVRSKLLTRCTIILFLNKYDLLQKKLKSGVLARKFMTSFGDRENSGPVFAKYLFQKFQQQYKDLSPVPRPFYGYVTSVIDTKATSATLASMRDGILRQHLKSVDLIA